MYARTAYAVGGVVILAAGTLTWVEILKKFHRTFLPEDTRGPPPAWVLFLAGMSGLAGPSVWRTWKTYYTRLLRRIK